MHPHGAEGVKPHSPARSRSLEAADAPPSRVPRRTSFLRGGRRHARGGMQAGISFSHSMAPLFARSIQLSAGRPAGARTLGRRCPETQE
jgi:hypothetical protein